MRTIETDNKQVKITHEDGSLSYLHRPDRTSLAEWYWISFRFIASDLGFDDCVTYNPRLAELGIKP